MRTSILSISILPYCFFISLFAIFIASTVAIYCMSRQHVAPAIRTRPEATNRVFEILCYHGRLLHVESLLSQLIELRLVHFLLL